MQNINTEAGYKKSKALTLIGKSPVAAIYKGKTKGIIFHKSTKMPFWGFNILAKKIKYFFLSQNL